MRRIGEAEAGLQRLRDEATPRFEAWLAEGGEVRPPAPAALFRLDAVEKDRTPDAVDPSRAGILVDGPRWSPGRWGRPCGSRGTTRSS